MKKLPLVVLWVIVVLLAARRDAEINASLTGTASDVTYQGTIAFADRKFGPLYLAIPEPRGTWATVCGPAGCVERRSTDVGPDLAMQRAGRIADVSFADFTTVCGVPHRIGLCPGSVTIQRRPSPTLPATDQ